MADVVVIGGGLHGLSAALHLRLRGCSVVVLEKDHCGRHASGVNAGGVRRLGRHPAEVPLAAAAMEIWPRISDLVDDDCGFVASGQVKVAETDAELAAQAERVAMIRGMGYDHEELIDRDVLREWLPAVAPHCVGGILVRGDGHANPFRTVTAFRRKAEALGVEVREGVPAGDLRRHGGTWRVATPAGAVEAPVVVNCAGAWGAEVARRMDDPAVPLSAEAFMLMITAPMAPFVAPVVGAAGRTLSFKQFANGTVMVGGGHRGRALPDDNRTVVNMRGLAESARTAAAIFPVMAAATVVRCWAGIEGETPDEIPVVGPSAAAEDAYHDFGFCGHGFQLGPVVGRLTADLVTQGATNLPLDPFRIDRFAGGGAEAA